MVQSLPFQLTPMTWLQSDTLYSGSSNIRIRKHPQHFIVFNCSTKQTQDMTVVSAAQTNLSRPGHQQD